MGKLLFRIARLKVLGIFVGLAFAYFPFLIPVKKVAQNKKVVAFRHPSPSYPNHILIIPRKIARTMFHLSGEDFSAVIEAATKIRYGDTSNFVLMINGGKRQDVMQAHFHLFSENLAASKGKKSAVPLPEVTFNLRGMLEQLNVPEEDFSLVFQFKKHANPAAYFM